MSIDPPLHPYLPALQKPQASASRVEETEILEGLSGLNIKNFTDCPESSSPNTPSSTNASLPTPPALKSSQVFLATELMSSSWYAVPPNAPLLKDSDSFTDGTGHSTFDFPLPASAGGDLDIDPSRVYPLVYQPPEEPEEDDDDDGLGLAVTPNQPVTYTNSLAVQLLPCVGDTKDAVRAWIEGVSAMSHQSQAQAQSTSYHSPRSQYHNHDYHHYHHQESSHLQPHLHPQPFDGHDELSEGSRHPRKRRRSLTANSDAEAQARRVRAWTPTIEPSYAPRPGARRGAYSKQRQEPEAPD